MSNQSNISFKSREQEFFFVYFSDKSPYEQSMNIIMCMLSAGGQTAFEMTF